MECRRRLGKRRMAHFSEAVRPPIHDFAALWGLGSTKENDNWQWEAPYRPPERDSTDQLPSWLMDLDQSMGNNPKHEHLESEDSSKRELLESEGSPTPTLQSTAAGDLEWFRDRIRAKAKSADLLDICETFFQRFKQSLCLGQVSATVLVENLREVPRLVRNNTSSKDMEDSLRISFYQAVWGGVTACKVLRPADIEPKALRILLTNLSHLPVYMSGVIIADILRSTTDKQKHELKESIYAVGGSLFTPDTTYVVQGKISQSTPMANARYSPPKNKLHWEINVLKDVVGALMETFGLYAPKEQARKEIRDLVKLSTAYANNVIFSGKSNSMRNLVRKGEDLRTTWLKFIACGPLGSEDLLVQACMIIQHEYRDSNGTIALPRLRLHALCDILFEYWACKLPGTSMMKSSIMNAHATFKNSLPHQSSRPHDSIVQFCLALEQQSIPWHLEIRCVLRMLRRIRGGGSSVYYCLRRLEKAKIYLDAKTLADEMTALYSTNVRHAAKLHRLYSRGRPETCAIPLEKFPGLAIAMIHDPSCNPKDIYNLLGGFRIWKETRINKARIRLVEQMAFEFSQVDFVSNRVALRNVAWCIRYLEHHKVPISSLIVRVLTDIGIEESIMATGSVTSGRLSWVLRVIARVEGKVVAKRIEAVVVASLCREEERRAQEQCARIGGYGSMGL
ncbi:hypothetical protein V490_07311 [Pseudogymnoascus sp. VKM F-3557]|nr:hypothetical protein V490_07311 [Pseudogymnoascus sp. VKM F-3557]